MKLNQKLTLTTLLTSNKAGLLLPLVLGLISSLAAVGLLATSGWFITAAGFAGVVGTTATFNYFTPGALVRLQAILRTAGRYSEQLTAHGHLLYLLKDLRIWSWQQLASQPQVQTKKMGDLLQRIIADVELINRWPLQVWMPWSYAALVSGLYLTMMAFWLPMLLPLFCISFLLMLVIIPYLSYRLGARIVWRLQLLGTYRRSRFINLFGALITLTIRGHWQGYAKRLDTFDNRQFNLEKRMQTIAITSRYLVSAITAITLGLGIYLAAPAVQANIVSGPVLAGFIFALLGINELLTPLAMTFIGTQQTRVGLHRLNQLRTDEKAPPLSTSTSASSEPLTSIELEQLSVKRQGAMNGINGLKLQIRSGDSLWLKGPSGIGKSTLLDALANQLQINSGDIAYNDRRCAMEERLDYQQQIGYLNQAPYIFNQTIAANLRLGDPKANDVQLLESLQAVGLDSWVGALPYGLATLLGEQGSNISGGQARRLGLARVLLQRPDLMLLDEPFEGLDSATIAKISSALTGVYRPPMLIIASHLETELLTQMQHLDLSQ